MKYLLGIKHCTKLLDLRIKVMKPMASSCLEFITGETNGQISHSTTCSVLKQKSVPNLP